MKAIIFFSALVIGAATVQAQSYKHPYGLTQTSKIENVRVEKQKATGAQRNLARRNYKNPQTDPGEENIVLLPARPVENVTNPLVAEGNYKRQSRQTKRSIAERKEEETIVQDTAKPNNSNRKD